ncbi:MAG: phosphopantetheine-binding protein [Xanthomonas sp.]
MQARNDRVTEYFQRISGKPDLSRDLDVFEAGLVNSLAVIQMIEFLERNFAIKVEIDDLDRANFASIAAVCAFLEGKAVADA